MAEKRAARGVWSRAPRSDAVPASGRVLVEATSSEYTDSETESETSSSKQHPHLSASANCGARRSQVDPRGGMNNSSGVIQDLDDAALADKMRKAQERLEGLDKHVADLRSRSVEQDALAKAVSEQTVAYLARVRSSR